MVVRTAHRLDAAPTPFADAALDLRGGAEVQVPVMTALDYSDDFDRPWDHPDQPLSFRLPMGAIESLGLNLPKLTRCQEVVWYCIIKQAINLARIDPDMWTSYSRRHDWWAQLRRYASPLTYASVMHAVTRPRTATIRKGSDSNQEIQHSIDLTSRSYPVYLCIIRIF